MTTTYMGLREADSTVSVHAGDGTVEPLPIRLDLVRHSPTGFEWGYGGSGPAQLALALCVHALTERALAGDPRAEFPVERAQRVYQTVKWRLVTPIHADAWTLTQEEVLAAIWRVEAEEGPLEINVCDLHPSYRYAGHRWACPQCLEEERRADAEERGL